MPMVREPRGLLSALASRRAAARYVSKEMRPVESRVPRSGSPEAL